MSTAPTPVSNTAATPSSGPKIKNIIIAIVFGLLIAFVGLEVMSLMSAQQTDRQRREVGMAGGRCATEPEVPGWLRPFVGDDYHTFMDHTNIVSVTLTGAKIGDANLAKIPFLAHLRMLDLHDSQVTSDGLKPVTAWKTLRTINLANTPVTDITPLSSLPNLESLQINFSQVRKEKLQGLAQLAKLNELNAGYTQVDDAGVKEIAKCTQLVELSLAASDLGETGLQPLQALKHLRLLVLKDAKFHPADLDALLKALPELEVVK